MSVVIRTATPWLLPLPPRELSQCLAAMLRVSSDGHAPPDVELHCVRDGDIMAANRDYLGCPGPTNILSFPGDDDMPGILLLSVDTLHRECLLYSQRPRRHLVRLLAHGLGHLLGLDHGEEMDRLCAIMEDAGRLG